MSTCSRCKEEKPTEMFNKNRAMKSGLQNQCRACQVGIQRENKLKAIAYLGGKCLHCGFDNLDRPEVFDFHHLFGKETDPTKLMRGTWEKLKVEIDKCILLCSNCHRSVTQGARV